MSRPGESDVTNAKAALRRQMRRLRGALAVDALERVAAAIAQRATGVPELRGARTIATYLAIRREIPTEPLRVALGGVRWAVPRVEGQRMVMVEHVGATVEGPYGVATCEGPEVDVDAVIVPGMAFDPAGRRLGWGGGYYDRWLAGREVFAVGLALDEAIVERVPNESHDRALDAVITPTRVLRPDSR